VIDPQSGLDAERDVLIEDGCVARVEQGITGSAERVIEAKDKWVLPGLVDLHATLCEPGLEYKEDIASGSKAAAAGGFTRILCTADTRPLNDCRSVTDQIVSRARAAASTHVHPIGALTRGFEGKLLCEYADMKAGGVVALGDEARTLMDAGLMRRALEYAATFDLPVFAHCEDRNLAGGGAMHEGAASTRCGITAQPSQAESMIVARDLELVALTGARYHVQHVSTAASVDHIRRARERGLSTVTCEVAAHHLVLTDEACEDYDTNTKVRPPLRSADDVEALKEALAEGVIDAIVSDHCPQTELEKDLEYGLASFGVSSFETTLSLVLGLVDQGVLKLSRMVELLCSGPARIAGLSAGTLALGAAADVAIVDPEARWVPSRENWVSRSPNSPFFGRELKGACIATIVGGEVAYERVSA
jgi:dihydroorotase